MSSQLKEFLVPNIDIDDIIIFKDANESESKNIDVANQIGYNVPIIKLNDFLVDRGMIDNCSLIFGQELLPQINITINDDKFRLRKTLQSEKISIVINFGTTLDPYYIKQEFILNNVSGIATSPIIYISGYLYIPELYKSKIKSYEMTSFNVIKEICKECNLGLLSNIDDTDDFQIWINDNKNNILFLNDLISHSYINDNTYIRCFIDQYNYLNLIDVRKSFENNIYEKTKINPIDGTELPEQVDVILSSKQNDESNYFKIQSFNLNLNYGSNTKHIPSEIIRNEINLNSKILKIDNNNNILKNQLLDIINYQSINLDSIHKKYNISSFERKYLSMDLEQGDALNVEMFMPVMLLYPYQMVPVKLYIQSSKEQVENQNVDNYDELYEMVSDEERKFEDYDEIHSGNYIIKTIKLSMSQDKSILTQQLNLQKIINTNNE